VPTGVVETAARACQRGLGSRPARCPQETPWQTTPSRFVSAMRKPPACRAGAWWSSPVAARISTRTRVRPAARIRWSTGKASQLTGGARRR